jgi:polyphosphate kinase 2
MDPYLNDFEKEAIKNARNSAELRPYQAELLRLQDYLEKEQKRMMIFFEGRDAAGKGGVIRRITRFMNERHYRVVALGKPTQQERSQWYLQRYVTRFPRGGEVVLFDRSWYNRAGVERVMNFCTKAQYSHFLEHTPVFEKWTMKSGIRLIKYWFDISMEEQTRRFQARIDDPRKVWKLSPMDVESYNRWYDYSRARDDMLAATSTPWAPWYVVRADNKKRARLNCISHLLSLIPYEAIRHPKVKLGKRKMKNKYDDQVSMAGANFIPEKY